MRRLQTDDRPPASAPAWTLASAAVVILLLGSLAALYYYRSLTEVVLAQPDPSLRLSEAPRPAAVSPSPPSAAQTRQVELLASPITVHAGQHRELLLPQLQLPSAVSFLRSAIYNPALAVHPAELAGSSPQPALWLYVRFEGRNSSGSYVQCPDDRLTRTRPCPVQNLRMISFVLRCPLNESLQCRAPPETLPYDLKWDRVAENQQERQVGPEDPRVLQAPDGRVFIFYNGPPIKHLRSTRCIRNMKVQQVYPELRRPLDLDLATADMNRVEKNWSPLGLDALGQLRLIRFVDPHQIVSCDPITGICKVIADNPPVPWFERQASHLKLQHFRLSSNAVLAPGNASYLAICHASTSIGLKRYYNHVYEFAAAAPWPILRIDPQPLELPLGSIRNGFVFVSSLTRIGNNFIVGFTANDLNAQFLVFSSQELTKGLRPLSQLKD